MRLDRLPAWLPAVLVAVALSTGFVIVWQRALIVHLGAEVMALRKASERLDEEAKALRMGTSRLASPGSLAAWGGTKEPWVMEGGRTREVVEQARRPAAPRVVDARR